MPVRLLFQPELNGSVLVSTVFSLQKEKLSLVNRSLCHHESRGRAVMELPFLHQQGRPTNTLAACPCVLVDDWLMAGRGDVWSLVCLSVPGSDLPLFGVRSPRAGLPVVLASLIPWQAWHLGNSAPPRGPWDRSSGQCREWTQQASRSAESVPTPWSGFTWSLPLDPQCGGYCGVSLVTRS